MLSAKLFLCACASYIAQQTQRHFHASDISQQSSFLSEDTLWNSKQTFDGNRKNFLVFVCSTTTTVNHIVIKCSTTHSTRRLLISVLSTNTSICGIKKIKSKNIEALLPIYACSWMKKKPAPTTRNEHDHTQWKSWLPHHAFHIRPEHCIFFRLVTLITNT